MRIAPQTVFHTICAAGLSLLYVGWLQSVDTAGFALLLFLGIMCLVRFRVRHKHIDKWVLVDLLFVLAFTFVNDGQMMQVAMGFVLFQGMYVGLFALAVLPVVLISVADGWAILPMAMATVLGVVLHLYRNEYTSRLHQRDVFANKVHEMELLHTDLNNNLTKVEHMSTLTERARIAADIHDNAGHEIIAGYISLQTVQKIFDKNPDKAMELFDKSLERLDTGIQKMRDTVHNLSTVASMGVDNLRDICQNFTQVPVSFQSTGDVSAVTVSVWQVLEAVLNEGLTNAIRHANPTYIRVELDATHRLIRVQMQNDGVMEGEKSAGSGLRNLRYRVTTVGGHLSVNKADTFKLVCVIPTL